MSKVSGKFVWYELMTSDVAAAEAFYRKVVGWNIADAGIAGMEYRILSVGTTGMGGLYALPPDLRGAGWAPTWQGYIGVDDVDGYAMRVKDGGGTIHQAPEDIPGVGRYAIAADPGGAAFLLFRSNTDQEPPAPAPGTAGYVGWHELHAKDVAASMKFYGEIFGWTREDAIDMGPSGVYQLFATGGPALGGIMTRSPQTPAPHWLFYINTDAIDAAASRVKEAGGKVVLGPMQVPGGSWIINCVDPQGARFALVAPKR